MIDMTKQYTYNGKPVRIYADGNDTYLGIAHGAFKDHDGWVVSSFNDSELVEVWQPTIGDIVLCWDEQGFISVGRYLRTTSDGKYAIGDIRDAYSHTYCKYIAPFTATLPETFKGL